MTATELLGARRLRAMFESRGLYPDKSLGQNFVIDPNTIRKVVSVAAISRDDEVLEIGAGAGSLTLGLAEAAGRVVALEFDRRLLPVLEEVVSGADNVTIVEADALQIDIDRFHAPKLVANLPYNIAATVVLRVLQKAPSVRELVVMTQREVGERLAASPSSKSYGAPSVLVAFFAEARVAGKISRRAFWPVPNVDSVLLRIVRRSQVPEVEPDRFAAVVRAAFAQRRKTLRNTLSALAGSPESAESALAAAGVDPGARAEQIGLDDYVALTEALG